eukprot:754731-Hanusia_phi.AAC.5
MIEGKQRRQNWKHTETEGNADHRGRGIPAASPIKCLDPNFPSILGFLHKQMQDASDDDDEEEEEERRRKKKKEEERRRRGRLRYR